MSSTTGGRRIERNIRGGGRGDNGRGSSPSERGRGRGRYYGSVSTGRDNSDSNNNDTATTTAPVASRFAHIRLDDVDHERNSTTINSGGRGRGRRNNGSPRDYGRNESNSPVDNSRTQYDYVDHGRNRGSPGGRGGRHYGSPGRGRGHATSSPRAPQIYTTDFFNTMHHHAKDGRNQIECYFYNVHKPNCDCAVVKRLFQDHSPPGMIILSRQRPGKVYVSKAAGEEYSVDPAKAECILRDEIFVNQKDDDSNFKMKNAQCLLNDEPNGFVCISSNDRERIENVCIESNKAAASATSKLHHDHAEDVAVLSKDLLFRLFYNRNDDKPIQELRMELGKQNIFPDDHIRFPMGHHLQSVIRFAKHDDKNSIGKYWFLMLETENDHQSENDWTLDLPGGKRHLGESSWEGAVRETNEESSVVVDRSWIQTKHLDGVNQYFLLEPPSLTTSSVVDDLVKQTEELVLS